MGYFASQFRRKIESQVKSNLGRLSTTGLNTQDRTTTPPSWVPHCHVNKGQQKDPGRKADYLSQLKMEGCIPGGKVLGHLKSCASFYPTKTRVSEELYY